jgi:Uri superfamily endonuclease
MKGVYILIMDANKNVELGIGKLGKILFNRGIYAYVGSAQNSLEKRLKRHFSKNKKLHWHIDYLLASPTIKARKAFYKNAKKEEECKMAFLLASVGRPVKDFGCSDCNCYSHLFWIKSINSVLSRISCLKEV